MQVVVIDWEEKLQELYIYRYLDDSNRFMARWFNNADNLPTEFGILGEFLSIDPAWFRRYRHSDINVHRACNLCGEGLDPRGFVPCPCGVGIHHRDWLPGTEELHEARADVVKNLETMDLGQVQERNKPHGVLNVGLLNLQECYSLLGYVGSVDESDDRLETSEVRRTMASLLSRPRNNANFER